MLVLNIYSHICRRRTVCVLEGQHYSPALELKTQGLADQLTEFHLFKGVAGLRNLSAEFTVGRSLLAQAQAF